jgi:arylsulfatase A-like enzyme
VLPFLDGATDPGRTVYADQINGYDKNARMLEKRPHDDFSYCVMDRRWKLVYRPNHPAESELFDLESDPKELVNLFDEAVEERTRLLSDLAGRPCWVTAPFPPEADFRDEALDALQDLGYAGGDPDAAPVEEANWAWTCVEHPEATLEAGARCPTCQGPPLLTRAR